MKKIILAITLVVLLGSCEGSIQNPPSVDVDLKQPTTKVSADSVKVVKRSENTFKILNKRAPFGERADDFNQIIEEVDGHKFFIISKSGINSSPSVVHLPSCWCFKDSVK